MTAGPEVSRLPISQRYGRPRVGDDEARDPFATWRGAPPPGPGGQRVRAPRAGRPCLCNLAPTVEPRSCRPSPCRRQLPRPPLRTRDDAGTGEDAGNPVKMRKVRAVMSDAQNSGQQAQTHVLTLEAVLIVGLLAVRVLAVGDYQSETALAVGQYAGTVGLALGTVIPLVSVLLPLGVLVCAALAYVFACTDYLGAAYSQLALAYVLVIPTLLASPAPRETFRGILAQGLRVAGWILIPIAVLGILAVVIFRSLPEFLEEVSDQVNIFVWGVPALVFALAYQPWSNLAFTEALRSMWLPAEQVTLKTGESFVGYTLKDTDDEIVVLREIGRSITRVKRDDLSTRVVCRIGEPDPLPFWRASSASVPVLSPCRF